MKLILLIMIVSNGETSEYLRYVYKKPLYGFKSDIVERFDFDDKNRVFMVDGVGIIQDECDQDFFVLYAI